MKIDEFTPIFVILSEYFGATPSQSVSLVYFEAFKNWEFSDFKRACQNVMQSRVYNGLPKIAEIEESVFGKIEDAAAVAFQSLLDATKSGGWDSVVFEDGAMGRTVEAMGGWNRVCEMTWEDWKYRKKEFDSLYIANLRRGNTEPMKFLGTFETHNNEQEEWKKFTPAPVTIKAVNKLLFHRFKAEIEHKKENL